jgi:hypothetical protein
MEFFVRICMFLKMDSREKDKSYFVRRGYKRRQFEDMFGEIELFKGF